MFVHSKMIMRKKRSRNIYRLPVKSRASTIAPKRALALHQRLRGNTWHYDQYYGGSGERRQGKKREFGIGSNNRLSAYCFPVKSFWVSSTSLRSVRQRGAAAAAAARSCRTTPPHTLPMQTCWISNQRKGKGRGNAELRVNVKPEDLFELRLEVIEASFCPSSLISRNSF
jgi:hypothetical protein